MDKSNWYFRQRVTNPEMAQFSDFIEQADWKNVRELLGSGILTGGVVKELPVPDDQFVAVEQTIARDIVGRRVNIIDTFGDTLSSIVLGLTLQVDSISVPSTVGTYLLFTSAPGLEPFTLVGQKIKLSRSQFAGNNGEFVIQQVVTTTWGGLIPSQIMVRIDEELDEEGYESGLSPRGTTVISEILSGEDSKANAAFDELAQDIRPVNPGNERWVSLYARFDRVKFDTRLDGNGQLVDYIQLENFKYVVDASEPEAVVGTNNRPAKRTNGDLFLADIQHLTGTTILNAQIDIGRQDKMNNLPALADQVLQYTQAIFHGPQVSWSGTNFSISGDAKLAIYNKAFLYNIPAFDIALADGEVIYLEVDRNAIAAENGVVSKVARGSVPEGSTDKLVFILADRNGTKVQGPFAGEMEPGQVSDIGDKIGEAYLSFTGMSSENDATPTYTNSRLAGSTSLQDSDDILADDLDTIENSLSLEAVYRNQDRNMKMIKGGVYGPSTYSAPNVTLPFSQDIFIHVPNILEVRNRIPAGSMVFTADGMVAYVEINRTGVTPADLTIQYAMIDALDFSNNNIFVLARRIGTDVLIGQTFNLKLGERLELDGALAEINRYFGQLKITAHETSIFKARITGSDIAMLDGSILTQELKNLIMKFEGAVIDFATGSIYEQDGITALGVDFAPFSIPNDQYFWYGVGIVPSVVAVDNTISVQVLVTLAESADADPDLAKKPAIAGTKKLGAIRIFNDYNGGAGAGITVSAIRQLGTGSGSGGSGVGDLTSVQEELRQALRESAFSWLTEIDFRVDNEDFYDAGTAAFDVANQVYNFPVIGDDLTTINLYNPDFLASENDSIKVEVHAFQDPLTPDTAFTLEATQDGAVFESVPMSRVANSNHWVGEKSLTPTYTTQHEYLVANADTVQNFTNTVSKIAIPIVVTAKQSVKDLTSYLNKVGSPTGRIGLTLCRDNAGEPGEIIGSSSEVDISTLGAGNISQAFSLGKTLLIPATYWLVLSVSDTYLASYSVGVHELGVRKDSSAHTYTGGDIKQYNGAWTVVAGSAGTFLLTGFIYELKLKYTSGTTNVNLLGLGVLFEEEGVLSESGEDLFQSFYVNGDNNETTFPLSWFPDPKKLKVYDSQSLQVYTWPLFTVSGNNVVFPDGFFTVLGKKFFIHFDQMMGAGFDNSDQNATLLSENHLGSENPTLDRSTAGRGILLRNAAGVLKEIWLDEFNNLNVTDPQ
ncbi:hypothetical protein MASR1M48_16260 [Lactococcus petauri]